MKAAILRGEKRIEIEDWLVPDFKENEVLVAVRSVAICGSDLHGFQGLIPLRRPIGITMGHELSGTVAEVGSKITNVKEGDHVAVDPQLSCGECHPCRQGWRNLCENVRVIGSAMRGYQHGANAEYVAVPGENVYKMPGNLSFDEAAMAEPVGNAIHLVRRTGVGKGANVVILGAGAIGSIVIQVAKGFGAKKVTVIEPSAFKRELAKKMGADETLHPDKDDIIEHIYRDTGGLGADIILECCGIDATYNMAIQLARKRGIVGAFGYLDEEVTFPMKPIIFSEISIIGSTGFYWPDDPALEMMADGRIDVKPLITHSFPLDNAQEAYELAEKPESIKVVINP